VMWEQLPALADFSLLFIVMWEQLQALADWSLLLISLLHSCDCMN
jgi:hypothetical protein